MYSICAIRPKVNRKITALLFLIPLHRLANGPVDRAVDTLALDAPAVSSGYYTSAEIMPRFYSEASNDKAKDRPPVLQGGAVFC